MKRIKYLLLLLLMPAFVSAYTGSSGMTVYECRAFADLYTNIKTSYEYKYCYRAACSTTGKWNLGNMTGMSGYRCTNGNAEPFTEWKSDGCTNFSGSCQVNSGIYCTRVQNIDCTRKKDGSPYNTVGTTTTAYSGGGQRPVVTANTTTSGTKKTTKRTGAGTTKVIIPVTTTEAATEATRPVVQTEPAKSNNLNINSITINGTDIKYRNGYDEYTIKLPYGVADLDIIVDTEDEKTVTYIEGAYDMPDTDTDIAVNVTAEDGSTKTIKIHVVRYTGESDDCNIANIAITDYELNNFDKNNYQYNLRVARKTKSLYMEIIPSDPLHATVEVLGNNNLANNSTITINVKAENGTLCTYHITVKKSSGLWIPVLITIVVLAILITAGIFIYRYIKRSKDMYKYE
ncbi:MAG: hypothetical protein K6C11_02555 [Bacilli bacterium]|nr:hypothetical protein [Bacilli bacterium]